MDEMYGYIKFKYEAWRAEQSKTSTGNQAAAAQSAVHGNVDSSVKLQPLELPGFNGNLGDWPMFYQIFKDARNVRIGGHNANNSEDSKKERYINRAKAIEIGDNGHNESKDYAPHPAICFESSSHCVEKAKSIVSDHIIEKIRKELQNPTLLPLPQKKSTIPDAATLVSSGTHQMFVLISLTVLTPLPPPADDNYHPLNLVLPTPPLIPILTPPTLGSDVHLPTDSDVHPSPAIDCNPPTNTDVHPSPDSDGNPPTNTGVSSPDSKGNPFTNTDVHPSPNSDGNSPTNSDSHPTPNSDGHSNPDSGVNYPPNKRGEKKSYGVMVSDYDSEFSEAWSDLSESSTDSDSPSEEEPELKKLKTTTKEGAQKISTICKKKLVFKKKVDEKVAKIMTPEKNVVGEKGLRVKKRTPKKLRKKRQRLQEVRTPLPNPCIPRTIKDKKGNEKIVECPLGCGNITLERQQSLNQHYYSLETTQEKKDWILHCSIQVGIKRKRKKQQNKTPRNRACNYKYYINEGEGKRQVCINFLTATLSIKKNFVYYTILNSTPEGTSKRDMRGRHASSRKTPTAHIEGVKAFIKSLPAVLSHYNRKRSSRLYLDSSLKNVCFTYELYKRQKLENNDPFVSEKIFRRVFVKDFNLSFHKPKKDKCTTCVAYENKKVNKETPLTDVEKENHKQHLKEKEYSAARFKAHQEIHKRKPNTLCVSFDLQKVLLAPHGNSMLYYFSRKYCIYNFTLYESKTNRGFNNLWGETEGKRGSGEISSILYDYIMRIDGEGGIKNLLLYADNCVAQNKNKIVMSAIYHALQKCTTIKRIQLNFLVGWVIHACRFHYRTSIS
uniref:Uncharacterized protein n=1 Tax=Cacopsylla melanoneura TaxID=428564 RepID=A0A8D8Z5L8_9HEMI